MNNKISPAMMLLMAAMQDIMPKKKMTQNETKNGFRPKRKKKVLASKPTFKARRLEDVTPAQYRRLHMGRKKKEVKHE